MGDGKNLKELINLKGTNVRQLAKAADLKPSTLYTIIQKDSTIRFDYGLKIARALDTDVNEICLDRPFSREITEEEIDKVLEDCGEFDKEQAKDFLFNRTYPILQMFGAKEMPQVDELLRAVCQLDEKQRKEFYEHLAVSVKYNSDSKRVEEISKIKGGDILR